MKYTTDERNRMVLEVLPTIRSVARRYCTPESTLYDDLVQSAVVALIDVFERFDPARGLVRNFAWHQARHAMQKTLLREGNGTSKRKMGVARLAVITAGQFIDEKYSPSDQRNPEHIASARQGLRRVAHSLAVPNAHGRPRKHSLSRVMSLTATGHNLAEIAAILGVSREYVRQMRVIALAKCDREC
jgi:RNA polymerase sigma factor (sigma-70 family)